MGVGMNEANKLGGALAAVGVASRMIGEEANQKIAQGAQAQQEAVKVGDEMPNLKEEMDAAQAKQANAQKEEDALYGLDVKSPEDAEAFAELKQGIDMDKKMAKVALETVDAKIKARTELLKRADKAMAKGRAWGGTY